MSRFLPHLKTFGKVGLALLVLNEIRGLVAVLVLMGWVL